MRLLTLCVVLTIGVTVSLASPLKTIVNDEASSESSESIEHKPNSNIIVKDQDQEDSSQSIEDDFNSIVKDSKEDRSSESAEDLSEAKDDAKEVASSKEKEKNDVKIKAREHRFLFNINNGEFVDFRKDNLKVKRSFRDADYMSSANNHLKVKDEGSIKYEKYLKLKRLRRLGRSAPKDDTSEENSSEEGHKTHTKANHDHLAHQDHHHHHDHSDNADHKHSEIPPAKVPATAPAESIVIAAKPDTAPEENAPKPEDHITSKSARRRRSAESSEENSSEEKTAKDHKHHEDHNHSEIPLAKVPATAPAESAPKPEDHITSEAVRHRRNNKSSEENSSEEKETKKVHCGHDHSHAGHEAHDHSAHDSQEGHHHSTHAGHEGHDHSNNADHKHSEIPPAKVPATAPAESIVIAAKPDTAPEENAPKPEDHITSKSARRRRSAESSKENSSEEKTAKDHKHHEDHKHPEIPLAKVPATAPAENAVRHRRNNKSSEENSSEEKETKKAHCGHDHPHAGHEAHEHSVHADPEGHDHSAHAGSDSADHKHSEIPVSKVPAAAPAENIVMAAKPDAAPSESGPKLDDHARRKRSFADYEISISSDELFDQDLNEVFIFKNEKILPEENFKEEELKNNKYFIVSDKVSEKEVEKSIEMMNTDEDYARGCGGNDDSSDDSTDGNETI